MLKSFVNIVLIILLLFFHVVYVSQDVTIKNKLINSSYEDLTKEFVKYYPDSTLAVRYAEAYFKKAKIDNDYKKIAEGYYLRIILDNTNHIRFDLYDSLIKVSEASENYDYLTISYYDKGVYYQNKFKYADALENYVIASANNNGDNKREMSFRINHNVGILKSRINDDHEALRVFKESFEQALEDNYIEKRKEAYFDVMFYLSDSYRKLNYLDSARTYTRLGLIAAKKNKFERYSALFTLLDGILTIENDTQNGIDKIQSSLEFLQKEDEKVIMSIAYQHIGQGYLKDQKYEKAIKNFLKVDSIIGDDHLVLPELLLSYNQLRNFYKKEGNLKLELYYINKIIKYDSIFNTDYRYLNKKISTDYDLPLILNNKETVISDLKNKNQNKNYIGFFLFIIIVIAIVLLFYQMRLKKKYEQQFHKIIKDSEKDKIKFRRIEKAGINDDIGVPQIIVSKILNEIEIFEKEERFLNKKISASDFAKSIGTNNSYFAKVFKHYKMKHFSKYLKELRLNYAFLRIKNDPKFRKYTTSTH